MSSETPRDEREDVHDEIDRVSQDLQRKARRRQQQSRGPIMSDDDKINVALQSSVTVPGAFHQDASSSLREDSQDARRSKHGWLRTWRMRAHQKRQRPPQPDTKVDLHNDEEVVDEIQQRMREFQTESNSEDRKLQEEEVRTKRRKWGTIIAVVVVVGIVVGVVVGMSGGGSKESNNEVEQEKSSERCVAGTADDMSERYSQLRSAVVTEFPNMTDAIDMPNGTARASLCWLAETDEFSIQHEQGDDLIQRFTLGLIYYHFVGITESTENGLSRSNWLDPLPVCDWDFVACDSSDVVTELRLNDAGLKGLIPTELLLLSHLVHLDVSANELSGSIPSAIFALQELSMFAINANHLTGTLPKELGSRAELRHVEIGVNRLSGTVPDLSQLTRLTSLSIRNNINLQGPFPNISGATNLNALTLWAIDVSGAVPSYIWGFSNLSSLTMAFTDLEGTITSEIGQLAQIEVLNLAGSRFHGNIPTELGELSLLKFLSFVNLAGLSGTIPSEVGRLSRLATLSFGGLFGLSGTIPSEICLLRNFSLETLEADCILRSCTCCTICS